jgi:hypothetical protein
MSKSNQDQTTTSKPRPSTDINVTPNNDVTSFHKIFDRTVTISQQQQQQQQQRNCKY